MIFDLQNMTHASGGGYSFGYGGGGAEESMQVDSIPEPCAMSMSRASVTIQIGRTPARHKLPRLLAVV